MTLVPIHILITAIIFSIETPPRLNNNESQATKFIYYIINSSILTISIKMVLSSFCALNKIEAGGMIELKEFIVRRLDRSACTVGVVKPVGRHFLVQDKHFKGTNHPRVSCPIQFLLRHRSSDTLLCQPVWTESSQRSKVNRKAKFGVKKRSVIRLDDFEAVAHEKGKSGYVFFLRNYTVVKKDVDDEAYERWITDSSAVL